MTKTMRTLYALAAVVILGTVVYAQETPKTGTGGEKKSLANEKTPNNVTSLNTLQGDLTLVAGPNISITPSRNSLTIEAPNALTRIVHDNTLTGNGTAALPLRVNSSSQDTAVDRFWESEMNNWTDSSSISLPIQLITVPVGKQLIVQHVAVTCELGAGEELRRSFITNGSGKYLELTVNKLGVSFNTWTTSQPMTLALNPGEYWRYA